MTKQEAAQAVNQMIASSGVFEAGEMIDETTVGVTNADGERFTIQVQDA